MRVLVACEFSGQVRNAFLALGHDAYSCDFYATMKEPYERHYRKDVTPLLQEPWDLVIAHPPCTYLCNTAVRWFKGSTDRWIELDKACAFFLQCLNANSPKIAVENPIMHCYARERIGTDYDQIIQPWQFGHPTSKATCLWLKGLPKLVPTKVVNRTQQLSQMQPPRHSMKGMQSRRRSITYSGIAEALAQQYGGKVDGK